MENPTLLLYRTTAAEIISNIADENANIIFGTVIDESMEGRVRITVLATGFGEAVRVRVPIIEDEAKKKIVAKLPQKPHQDDLDIPAFLRAPGQ